MVSMKDIAKQCHVSVASVSKALNGYSDIGEETRNLIITTAHEMGYLPNSSARALKTKKSYNLGVLFVDAAMNGLTHEDIQDLIRSELPVVTIDHTFEGKIAVVSNNVQGMEELVSYIYSMGHKKIAYIHGDDTPVTRNRLSGFYRTTQRYGLEIPDVKASSYRDLEMAAKATGELLDLPNPPTCIMYPDDYAAVGGMNEIRERGLRIPEDISITGYDGIDLVRMMEPKLTTLCQDTRKIGRMAAEKLISLIEHPKTTLVDKFSVDGVLFKGGSVGRNREC